jgi:hypothetical protein
MHKVVGGVTARDPEPFSRLVVRDDDSFVNGLDTRIRRPRHSTHQPGHTLADLETLA